MMNLRSAATLFLLALPLAAQPVTLLITTGGAVTRSTLNGPACFPCTANPACPSAPDCICPFYAYIDALVTPSVPQGTRLLMLTRAFDLSGTPILGPGGEWVVSCDNPTPNPAGPSNVVRTEVQIGTNEPGSWFGGMAFEATLVLVATSSSATPGTFYPTPQAVPGYLLDSGNSSFSIVDASSAPFGQTWPVVGGPKLRGAGGAPAAGNVGFGLQVVNADPSTPVLLFVGLPALNSGLSAGACDIYLDVPTLPLFAPINPYFAGITGPSGDVTFSLPITGFPPGLIVAFQGVILGPATTFTDGLLVSVF